MSVVSVQNTNHYVPEPEFADIAQRLALPYREGDFQPGQFTGLSYHGRRIFIADV